MEGQVKVGGMLPKMDGVPLLWYPMRVTYRREMKVKECLEDLGIESFVPMRWENEEGVERKEPAIHNLIFVHSTQQVITSLKMERRDLAPLRYMMKRNEKGENQVMTVPDREMDNFIMAASVKDSSMFLTDDSDYFSKIGRMVRITEGQFKGVVGVVKRIKKNRCVVVRIQGVAAVVIANVPGRFVEEI